MPAIVTTLFTSSAQCILLCFFRCFQILDLVFPSSHMTALAQSENNIFKLYPSSGNLVATKIGDKTFETSNIQSGHGKRVLRESWHQNSSIDTFFNLTDRQMTLKTKVNTENGSISSQKNFTELNSSCCIVTMTTVNSVHKSHDWTATPRNTTYKDGSPRETTQVIAATLTNGSQTVNDVVQHNAAVIVGIVFGAIAAVLFIGAISLIYIYIKRRLSHNTTSKTDLSSILEDHMTMSYIETRYDRQRNLSDEVVSLDNDSFLQSLETTSLSYLPTLQKTV